MIDLLYKIELEMGKVIAEVKAITDAKWNKCLDELNTIRDVTWPDIDTYISIWEVIAGIKALPSGDCD